MFLFLDLTAGLTSKFESQTKDVTNVANFIEIGTWLPGHFLISWYVLACPRHSLLLWNLNSSSLHYKSPPTTGQCPHPLHIPTTYIPKISFNIMFVLVCKLVCLSSSMKFSNKHFVFTCVPDLFFMPLHDLAILRKTRLSMLVIVKTWGCLNFRTIVWKQGQNWRET